LATDPRSLTGTRVCPKGRKHIDGGEAPVYEKYQIHSPNGAVELVPVKMGIEESLRPVHLRFWEHILFSVRREIYREIIINFFHPFGAKFLSSCKWGCVVLLLRGLYADSPSGLKKV